MGITSLAANPPVIVYAPTPTLAVTPTSVNVGGPVTVTVTGGPGNPTDCVGLYRQGDPDTAFRDYKYLSDTKTPPNPGRTTATLTFRMPDTPGVYEFRLLADNDYIRLATSPQVAAR